MPCPYIYFFVLCWSPDQQSISYWQDLLFCFVGEDTNPMDPNSDEERRSKDLVISSASRFSQIRFALVRKVVVLIMVTIRRYALQRLYICLKRSRSHLNCNSTLNILSLLLPL